jgi:predicted small secreted protein
MASLGKICAGLYSTFSLVKDNKITRDSMTSLVAQIKKEVMPASYTSHLAYTCGGNAAQG